MSLEPLECYENVTRMLLECLYNVSTMSLQCLYNISLIVKEYQTGIYLPSQLTISTILMKFLRIGTAEVIYCWIFPMGKFSFVSEESM
jgi:hypothetical protein